MMTDQNRRHQVAAACLGAAATVAGRVLLHRGLLVKLRRNLDRLAVGHYEPLLSAYAQDAVLRFHEGRHRWSGTHQGKTAIARFLQDFVRAGLQGEIVDLWIGGPPWALTLVIRFDDRATGPDGRRLYANRVVLVVRTCWGKITHHEDFYEDTARIETFENELQRLGITPVDTAGITSPTNQ